MSSRDTFLRKVNWPDSDGATSLRLERIRVGTWSRLTRSSPSCRSILILRAARTEPATVLFVKDGIALSPLTVDLGMPGALCIVSAEGFRLDVSHSQVVLDRAYDDLLCDLSDELASLAQELALHVLHPRSPADRKKFSLIAAEIERLVHREAPSGSKVGERIGDYMIGRVLYDEVRGARFIGDKNGRQCLLIRYPYLGLEAARNFSRSLGLRRHLDLAMTLQHPNLVPLYEHRLDQEDAFLAVPAIWEHIRTPCWPRQLPGGQLPPHRALGYMTQLLEAADYVHSHGLVLTALSPKHIWIVGLKARICLAQVLADEVENDYRRIYDNGCMSDATMDSAAYLASEHITGGVGSAQGDQYLLGVILFEMLVGAPPFGYGQSDAIGVIFKSLSEKPPDLSAVNPDLPKELDPILHRMLAKTPDDRFPTCTEIIPLLIAAGRGCSSDFARPT